MTLVDCSVCRARISDKAATCPKCEADFSNLEPTIQCSDCGTRQPQNLDGACPECGNPGPRRAQSASDRSRVYIQSPGTQGSKRELDTAALIEEIARVERANDTNIGFLHTHYSDETLLGSLKDGFLVLLGLAFALGFFNQLAGRSRLTTGIVSFLLLSAAGFLLLWNPATIAIKKFRFNRMQEATVEQAQYLATLRQELERRDEINV